MSRNRYEVTVSECKEAGQTWSTGVLVDPSDYAWAGPEQAKEIEVAAVEKAIAKMFGRKAGFAQDNFRPGRYGQVTKGNNCITGRVRVDVDRA